jgi:hypothetical protein
MGRYSAEHALKGIYSIFVKLGSPGFIVSRGSRIMSQPSMRNDSDRESIRSRSDVNRPIYRTEPGN